MMSSPRGNNAQSNPQHLRNVSNDGAHASVAVKTAMTNHDLDYFEEMIH
jgi:hypothetical protein